MSLPHDAPTGLRSPAFNGADPAMDNTKNLPTISQFEREPLRAENFDEKKDYPQSSLKSRLSGWRGGLAANTITITSILLINLIMFIVIATRHHGILFQGSCNYADRWMSASHVIINILGSLVLGSSNYAMQILSAPTRQELDTAHQQKKWLSIGTPVLTNFRYISWARIVLCVLLALSALPFHLMYNSFIYSTTTATEFYSVIASPIFLSDKPYDMNAMNITNGTLETTVLQILDDLKGAAKNGNLQNLSSSQCSSVYSANIQNSYRNFLAITNYTSNESSVIALSLTSPLDTTPNHWECINQAGNVTYPCSNNEALSNVSSLSLWNSSYWKPHKPTYNVSVSYCLAEKISAGGCTILANQGLLGFIIAANVLKLACMILLQWKFNLPTLVTLGDAVASFLEDPDPCTRGYALGDIDFDGDRKPSQHTTPDSNALLIGITLAEADNVEDIPRLPRSSVRAPGLNWLQNPPENRYSSKLWPNTWWSAVPSWDWILSSLAYFLILFMTSIMLISNVMNLAEQDLGISVRDLMSMGFGQVNLASVVTGNLPTSISLLILIANTPQLALSLGYIIVNRVLTMQVASREWANHAYERKGLRVTRPHEEQRSTYWLQLPLRFSIPLLIFSMIFHFAVSQSFFLVSINVLAAQGENVQVENFASLGVSAIAQFFVIILTLFILLFVFALSFVRNRRGIPPARSCSAIISAACHPNPSEKDVALKKIRWGDIGFVCKESIMSPPGGDVDIDTGMVRHCSFSSGHVDTPLEGEIYL